MDFQSIMGKLGLREMYEKCLSQDFKNYRKDPPVSSLHEIGEITLIHNSKDGKNGKRQTSFIEPDSVSYFLESYYSHGCIGATEYDDIEISDSQIQKLFDYVSLEDLFHAITDRVETGYEISQESAKEKYEMERDLERLEEEHQRELEDKASSYDEYGGDVPPDPLNGFPNGDDYSRYEEEDIPDEEDTQKDEKVDSYQMAYKIILSLDWFKNYRMSPPASSFQELGDFSSYDEFEIKINSLIVDLFNKNDFESKPYQKLFDYLPIEKIFKLIIKLVHSTQSNFVKPKLDEKEFLKANWDF